MPKDITRPMVRIHDVTANEIIDREMNDEEFANWQAQVEANKAAEAAKAKAETDKAALLAQLGITEEQAKLLLG